LNRGEELEQAIERQMDEKQFAKLRVQAVEQHAGSPVTPVRSADEFIGTWQMRFGGPVAPNKVQLIYQFSRDGKVKAGDVTWRWKLNKNGTLSLFITTPPDPTIPGLEEGASTEELRYPFKTKDGRLVLSNEDTSVVELLSKATAKVGK